LWRTCKIVQIIGTRIKLAYALAKQWFGIYTSAEEANDGNSSLPVNLCSNYLLHNKTLLTNNFLLEQNGFWMVWLVFLLRYLSSVSLGIMRHGIGASRLVFLLKAHIMHLLILWYMIWWDPLGLFYFTLKWN